MFITAGPVIDSELCARGTGDALLFCYRLYDPHWQHNLGLGWGAHARGKRWARGRGDALFFLKASRPLQFSMLASKRHISNKKYRTH